jgi:hypothetical protein
MTGQEFKILFKQDRAYLTPEKSLTLSQVGLPEIAKTFKAPAFWTIHVLNYREAEQKLFVKFFHIRLAKQIFHPTEKYFQTSLGTSKMSHFGVLIQMVF